MFTKKEIANYADILIWGLKTARTKKFKKGDIISLKFDHSALPLSEQIFSKLIQEGYNVDIKMLPTHIMERDFFSKASENQLVNIAPGTKEFYSSLNGSIYISAPKSLTHLKNCNPSKISRFRLSRKEYRDILIKREERGEFGWTLALYPTKEIAEKAGLTLKQYKAQVVKACFLKDKDPVSKWQDLFMRAKDLKHSLNSMKTLYYHIESDNVDLKIFPGKKRKWIGLSGHNIPSFEIFTSPDCRKTQGIYYADQPSYLSGNYITEIRLEFKDGKVIKSDAKTGKVFLKKMISMDKNSNKVGEFSLTDKNFSKIDHFMADTLYDENFGGKFGNCHIALGNSYTETYRGDAKKLTKAMKAKLGFNDSALHWDIINREKKKVTAYFNKGKKVIYENGKFVV